MLNGVSLDQLQGGAKFFLDVDIEKCCDKINHEYLLEKPNSGRMFRNQIESWLKAGITHSLNELSSEVNLSDIPQGGIISSLLMKVALHCMETYVLSEFGRDKIKAGASIYYENLVYFAQCLSQENPRIKTLRNLFKKQGSSCSHCNLCMLPSDIIKLHHQLNSEGKNARVCNLCARSLPRPNHTKSKTI